MHQQDGLSWWLERLEAQLQLFDAIESVDRPELVDTLAKVYSLEASANIQQPAKLAFDSRKLPKLSVKSSDRTPWHCAA